MTTTAPTTETSKAPATPAQLENLRHRIKCAEFKGDTATAQQARAELNAALQVNEPGPAKCGPSQLRLRNVGNGPERGAVAALEVVGVDKARLVFTRPAAHKYARKAFPYGSQSACTVQGAEVAGMLYDRDEWDVMAGDPEVFQHALATGKVERSELDGSSPGNWRDDVPCMAVPEPAPRTRPTLGESWTCKACGTPHTRPTGINGCGRCGSLGMRYERVVHLMPGDAVEGCEVVEAGPKAIVLRNATGTWRATWRNDGGNAGWTAVNESLPISAQRAVGGLGRADWLGLVREIAERSMRGAA